MTRPIPETDSVLRTGGPPDDMLEDVNGEAVPKNLFQFGVLGEDTREYPRHWAASADWEQHQECAGPAGALARAQVSGRLHTHVYRLQAQQICAELRHGEESYTMLLLHWPELGNAAHSHILLPPCSEGRRKSARRYLRMCAVPIPQMQEPTKPH